MMMMFVIDTPMCTYPFLRLVSLLSLGEISVLGHLNETLPTAMTIAIICPLNANLQMT